MAATVGRKILIVEDDEGIAHLERTQLERCGHIVTCARTAEEALHKSSGEDPYDLFVLDYALPGEVNGLALFLLLKERGCSAPAILVTGFEDPQIIMHAMRAGVRDFLPKTTDYLDDFPLTVERVLRQVAIERQAAESHLIKEKQDLLEAAFDAARLASFVWEIPNNLLRTAGYLEDMLGSSRIKEITDLESFICFINPSDQELFRNALNGAVENRKAFEHQFRIYRDDGSLRWVFAKGRYQFDRNGAPIRLTCVLSDISGRKRAELELLQSHEKIKALNERLQMGMVETNHRVKNNLQKLISLLNYQLRTRNGTLTAEDVKGIVGHIHGLAALHDVLVEEVQGMGDGMTVNASEVLEKVIDVLGPALDSRLNRMDFHPCRVTARQAASLSVILNELLANSIKHGNGQVYVSLTCEEGRGVLTVANEGSQFPPLEELSRNKRTGLVLVGMLAKSDLDAEPTFRNSSSGTAEVTLDFALSEHASASNA